VSEQISFEDRVKFADNPEPRVACVLLLDVSGSMAGGRIQALNEGLATFKRELTADTMAARRVEVAVVTFGGGQVRTLIEFAEPERFEPPVLTASGDTPMGTAILRALEMIDARKKVYKAAGNKFYRPWVFLITDGEPTDDATIIASAAAAVRQADAGKHVAFFCVGVAGADPERLKQISPRPPKSLDGLKFAELFQWLSNSLGQVGRSVPGTDVPLDSTDPWSKV
jgi:uncharacterized protein YegL